VASESEIIERIGLEIKSLRQYEVFRAKASRQG